MKKQLTLIRHAKSSWDDASLSDHERSLNGRGCRDAARMGEVLRERGVNFDLVLCSSAKRARETLALLREQLEIEDDAVNYLDDLYCAPAPALVELIRQVDKNKNNIAIIAHNPGLEDLAAILSDESEAFATCTVMQITFEMDNWTQVDKIIGKRTLFLSPKTI